MTRRNRQRRGVGGGRAYAPRLSRQGLVTAGRFPVSRWMMGRRSQGPSAAVGRIPQQGRGPALNVRSRSKPQVPLVTRSGELSFTHAPGWCGATLMRTESCKRARRCGEVEVTLFGGIDARGDRGNS